jgi:hypothetical protein
MCYGIMFWGNSSYAINVFRVQKRVTRVMLGIGSHDSCRRSFVVLGVLPLLSQYIFSLLCYMVNNIHLFSLSDIHDRDMRLSSNLNLYQPSAQRASYLKGTYYMGIVAFNNLPAPIKRLYDNPTAFKRALKKFLCDHSFCTLNEYLNYICFPSWYVWFAVVKKTVGMSMNMFFIVNFSNV